MTEPVDLIEGTLVDLVHSFPHLWDKKDPQFKDSIARENAWTSIATIMEMTCEECDQMWTSIRLKYVRERRKIKTIPSGSASYTIKWALYDKLGFMDEAISTRRTKGNIKPKLIKKTMEVQRLTTPSDVWKYDVDNLFSEDTHSNTEIVEDSLSTDNEVIDDDKENTGEVNTSQETPKLNKTEELRVARNKKVQNIRKRKGNGNVDNLVQSCSKLGDTLASIMNSSESVSYDEHQLFGLSIAETLKSMKSNQKRTHLKIKLLSVIAEMESDDSD